MPAAGSKLRTHALAYAGLAFLLFLSLTTLGRDAIDRFDEIRHPAPRYPLTLGDFAGGGDLQPEAEEAGVHYGDIVVSVEGRPLQGWNDYYATVRRAQIGDRLQLQLRTGTDPSSTVRDVSIRLREPVSTGLNRFQSAVGTTLFLVVLPLLCLALGFWVAAVRVNDRAAWLLLTLMLSITAIVGFTPRTMWGRPDALQPLLSAYRGFFGNLVPAALMFFAIAFPERLPFDRQHPWAKWVVFGPLLLRKAVNGFMVAAIMHHMSFVHRFDAVTVSLSRLDILDPVALVAFFGIFGYRVVTASDRDARRRLLLLATAGIISFVPPVILILLANVRDDVRIEGWTAATLLTMLIFPMTMAYVIVAHRAMDVRVVIRQGLQYVLARGGIRAIQLALVVVVTIGATSLLSGGAGFVRVALVVAGTVAIVAIGGRFADRLRGWVDRRFFRDAYETDAILSDLASRVRTMLETEPLLEMVAGRIAESLHVPRIAILLNEGGAFRPVYALGYASLPSLSIGEHSVTVRRLRKQQHALVAFYDADSWVQLTDDAERASLEQLKPELLLPLSLNEKILGIMSLGPKQSEEPFSKTDIRLLDSVAAQTGLALENGRLTEMIKVDAAAREKQRRELEIAHEVQERLFPQEYPPVAGLEYAGACRPALGVGGDYYDFILLSKTELGVAIGDISGKGIPAALLMATLRAYLRGLTSNRQTDLTEVMAKLNNLVFESSAANRYATFFYAEFNSATRALNYVNAGHNAPIVFRGSDSGQTVVRLDAGGPVIGLMEDCVYHQGCITLETGDVLVAYTDGISEAMNSTDDEWGEEQLMAAVRSNRSAWARELIERLMTSADAFVAGAPQHDDMTLVVVRAI